MYKSNDSVFKMVFKMSELKYYKIRSTLKSFLKSMYLMLNK